MTHPFPSVAGPQPFGSPQADPRRDAPAQDTTPRPPAGASILSIQVERQRQREEFGHTLAGDLAQPLMHMPRAARDMLAAILDDIQFHKSHAQMRRRAVKAAALLVAFIDRLDAEAAD